MSPHAVQENSVVTAKGLLAARQPAGGIGLGTKGKQIDAGLQAGEQERRHAHDIRGVEGRFFAEPQPAT
ncbi:hypothetical protein NOVOSPHI9U_620006 [Novosphingobium sp. 9U]|nr:hypothetical protein NOVOSPHI9U_620006 [Novosphingobium sp. 9U]